MRTVTKCLDRFIAFTFISSILFLVAPPVFAQILMLKPSGDAVIYQRMPDDNESTLATLTLEAGEETSRIVLKFDVSALADLQPEEIVSAQLRLNVLVNDGQWSSGKSGRITANQVTDFWAESDVSWNNISYQKRKSDSEVAGDGNTSVVQFDVTKDVREMLSGNGFYSWLLKKEKDSKRGLLVFGSRESDLSPVLILSVNSKKDFQPPELKIISPTSNLLLTAEKPTVNIYYSDIGSGVDLSSVNITLDDTALVDCEVERNNATCSMPSLQPGVHSLYASISDNAEVAKTSNTSLNFIYLNSADANSGFASRWHSGTSLPNDDDAFSGDFYLDTSTGDVYQKNENTWQLTMNITGPQGETGAVGAQGLSGQQGIQGEKGETGAQGDTGLVGPQGIPGAQGIQGIQGQQGLQGEKGEKGATGSQGNAGLAGPQGLPGAQGIQGQQGPQGETGPQGEAGSSTGGTATNIYNGRINLQNLAASVLPNGWSVSQAQAGVFKLTHNLNTVNLSFSSTMLIGSSGSGDRLAINDIQPQEIIFSHTDYTGATITGSSSAITVHFILMVDSGTTVDGNAVDGTATTNLSCASILQNDPTATSGTYFLTMDSTASSESISVYCDMDFDQGGWTLAGSVYDGTRVESSSVTQGSNTVFNYDIFSRLLERSTKGVRIQWGPNDGDNLLIYKESLGGHVCHNFLDNGVLGSQDISGSYVMWSWDESLQCGLSGADYTVIVLDRKLGTFDIFAWSNRGSHYNIYNSLTNTWDLYTATAKNFMSNRISTESFVNIYIN